MLRWLTDKPLRDTPARTPKISRSTQAVAAYEEEPFFTPGITDSGIKVKEISFTEFLHYARKHHGAK